MNNLNKETAILDEQQFKNQKIIDDGITLLAENDLVFFIQFYNSTKYVSTR